MSIPTGSDDLKQNPLEFWDDEEFADDEIFELYNLGPEDYYYYLVLRWLILSQKTDDEILEQIELEKQEIKKIDEIYKKGTFFDRIRWFLGIRSPSLECLREHHKNEIDILERFLKIRKEDKQCVQTK